MYENNRSSGKDVYYDPEQELYYFYISLFDPSQAALFIGLFITDMDNAGGLAMGCQDYAGILQAALQSQGIADSRFQRFKARYSEAFWTWPLSLAPTPLGSTASYSISNPIWFFFHCGVSCNGYRADSAAGYLLSLNGSNYKDIVWNWQVLAHWQSPFAGAYYGLVFSRIEENVNEHVDQEITHNILPSGITLY